MNLLGTLFAKLLELDALFVFENGDGNKLSPSLRIDCDSVAKAPLGVAGLETSTVRSVLCGSGLPAGDNKEVVLSDDAALLVALLVAADFRLLRNRSLSLSS